jgi:hypothetical protein
MRTAVIVAALVLSLSFSMPGGARCDELSESYFPLKEGMRWEYNVTSDQGETKKLIITNLAPREVNGKKVTPRQWVVGGTTFFELMDQDDTGTYRCAEQKGENAPPIPVTPVECHLRFPITQGNSWNMTTTVDNRALNLSLTIESVTDNVTVPAGSFQDCVKVKQVGENDAGAAVMGYEWYAPKVGVVKSMVTIKKKTPEGTRTENRVYQLQSFKP